MTTVFTPDFPGKWWSGGGKEKQGKKGLPRRRKAFGLATVGTIESVRLMMGDFKSSPQAFLLDTNIHANTTNNVVGGSYFVRRVIRILLAESFSGIPRKIYSDV